MNVIVATPIKFKKVLLGIPIGLQAGAQEENPP
jgi:hypothetical protein